MSEPIQVSTSKVAVSDTLIYAIGDLVTALHREFPEGDFTYAIVRQSKVIAAHSGMLGIVNPKPKKGGK